MTSTDLLICGLIAVLIVAFLIAGIHILREYERGPQRRIDDPAPAAVGTVLKHSSFNLRHQRKAVLQVFRETL